MPCQHLPPPVGRPPSTRVPDPPEAPTRLDPLTWIRQLLLGLHPDPRTWGVNMTKYRPCRGRGCGGRPCGLLVRPPPSSLRSPHSARSGVAFRGPMAPRPPTPVPSCPHALDTPEKWSDSRLAGGTHPPPPRGPQRPGLAQRWRVGTPWTAMGSMEAPEQPHGAIFIF